MMGCDPLRQLVAVHLGHHHIREHHIEGFFRAMPYTGLGPLLGFTPLPALLLGAITLLGLTYLLLV
jgi:hypothetical protein